jgi:predicted outer membrane repeat protein
MYNGTQLLRRSKTMRLNVVLVAFLLGGPSPLHAVVIHVPTDQLFVQSAIDIAGSGDTVLVDPGVYVENLDFSGKNIVVGSLFLTTDDEAYISQTSLDGGNNGTVVTFAGGESLAARLCGFTIEHGSSNESGGGILCTNGSSPTISNVMITGNHASDEGGGIACTLNSHPLISNAGIVANTSDWNGGGIYCHMSNPTISDVTIMDNITFRGGGGIYCSSTASPTLSNVEISWNQASYDGGGMVCTHGGDAILENVSIHHNSSDMSGGGLACPHNGSPVLSRVSITENSAAHNGGGLSGGYISQPRMLNVTLSKNVASLSGGAIWCSDWTMMDVVNSIIWENEPNEICFDQAHGGNRLTIGFSNLLGGFDGVITNDAGTVNWLDGNINENPQFVDPQAGDFHLEQGSPCVDAGTHFLVYEGDTLINMAPEEYYGVHPDMGAFESEWVSAEDSPRSLPCMVVLHELDPNPFSSTVRIRYELPKEARVRLSIRDVAGRGVSTLVDAVLPKGRHMVCWDGVSDSGALLRSGVYLCHLQAGRSVQTEKAVLLR